MAAKIGGWMKVKLTAAARVAKSIFNALL